MTRSDEFSDTVPLDPATSARDIGRVSPGTRLGRYELGPVLGSGGMGVVYRARDPELSRDVAIKVVQAGTGRSLERLLVEARAMAKLDHPSIVPVFDVGTIDDAVYMVMPYIAGGTLHEWIHSGRKPWTAVFDRLVIAGRGLAAAHAAGFVHRDFKPSNVLVDGANTLVVDFGLVALDTSDQAQPLVQAGASTAAGTPGYMAPQQARGESVDARADQFSYCITFWEALHGERPSNGGTPPAGTKVPGWLTSALARGFADDASERWPSISALIEHVAGRRRQKKALVVSIAAISVVAFSVGGALILRDRASTRSLTCPDPGPQLAGVWDAAVKARIHTELTATAPAIAASTLARVVPALDAYTDSWRSAKISSCKAARVSHTLSPGDLDRRELCMERTLSSLRTLTSLLQDPTGPIVVVRADDAVASLPAVDDCADTRTLTAQPLPASPSIRAQIEAAERDLETVLQVRWSDAQPDFLVRATRVVETARSLKYAPLLARSLDALADAQANNGTGNEASLRELAQVAAEAHDDRLAATAWLRLLNVLSSRKGDQAEAQTLLPVAQAAIDRAGETNALLFRLSIAKGSLALKAEAFEEARREFATARSLAADARERGLALDMETGLTMQKRGPAAAIKVAEEALQVNREAYGARHPATTRALDLLAQANVAIGEFDRADAYAREALEINEVVFGELFPGNSTALRVLGHVASMRGQKTEAKANALKAVAIAEKAGKPERLGAALQTLGNAVAEVDGPEAALPVLERGLATIEAALGKEHMSYLVLQNELAAKLAASKRCAEAMRHLQHTISSLEARPRLELVAMPLLVRAECEKLRNNAEGAVATYDRVLEICKAHRCEPNVEGAAMGSLGQLLIETRRDRTRGTALMQQARAFFLAKGMSGHVEQTDQMMRGLGLRPRQP